LRKKKEKPKPKKEKKGKKQKIIINKNLDANSFRFLQPKFCIPDVTSEVESLNVGWVFKHDLQNNK
jgi:hypothetical protein